MEMTGERRIAAPRQVVWDALNDPGVLRASIPGCESIERAAADCFEARVAMRVGPMAIRFGGKVKLENLQPPERYSISGEGSGGAMGFAKGNADVVLQEDGPGATRLGYTARAQIGGKMAQLGARLIDSTAKQVSDQFFTAFATHVEQAYAQAGSPASEAPPALTAATVTAVPPQLAPAEALSGGPPSLAASPDRAAAAPGWILYAAAAALLAAIAYALL
ncbi:SRPBCC family protein [Roseomonas sp. WA12]